MEVLEHRLVVVEHGELGHPVDLIRVGQARVAQTVQQRGEKQRKLPERREVLANTGGGQRGGDGLTHVDACMCCNKATKLLKSRAPSAARLKYRREHPTR